MTQRIFIARHGETVFNAAAMLQGETLHTPLTRRGFAQAEAMGLGLRDVLGARPDIALWSSPAGRALQTMAIICEVLELDFHAVRVDPRLTEIGMGAWGGRSYADVTAEHGPIVDPVTRLLRPAPGGELYAAIAERVGGWLAKHGSGPGDRLVVMHGISSRVLRGVMRGLDHHPEHGAPIADGLAQGAVTMFADGDERIVVEGTGGQHA